MYTERSRAKEGDKLACHGSWPAESLDNIADKAVIRQQRHSPSEINQINIGVISKRFEDQDEVLNHVHHCSGELQDLAVCEPLPLGPEFPQGPVENALE